MDLQKFFNSFDPRLSPKTIRLIHGSLRTALSQAVVWELIPKNPAVGVKLPRRKVRKPPLVLSLPDIRRMIEAVPEPSKSLVTLIVFASLRVGEVLELRWKRVKSDRLLIVERVYDGEFDDVKTDAGHREVPFDQRGVIAEVLRRCRARSKFLGPEARPSTCGVIRFSTWRTRSWAFFSCSLRPLTVRAAFDSPACRPCSFASCSFLPITRS